MNNELVRENTEQESSTESRAPIPSQHDMSDDDLPPEQPLYEAVKVCAEVIHPVYIEADQKAILHQKYHRFLTILAAISGTVAVLFAIIQLSGLFLGAWPLWVEITFALFALIAVSIGIIQARHPNWLLYRHMAERCRLLKFRFLIDPNTWCDKDPQPEKWKVDIRNDIEAIKNLTRKSLKAWVEDFTVERPTPSKTCLLEKAELHSLITYYRAMRINVQSNFFYQRSEKFESLNRVVGKVPVACFFASVCAALIHFLIDLFLKPILGLHVVSIVFIVLAAFLPLLGATFRTVSTAHEFARNASLYRARYSLLQRLDETLQMTQDKKELLLTLWNVEQLLESEHREWLRLMLAAEWY